MIARTELANAYNAGHFLATVEAMEIGLLDDDMLKIVCTSDFERICDSCRVMEGEVVPIKEKFSNGFLTPTFHPQCMCTLLYEEKWLHEEFSGGNNLGLPSGNSSNTGLTSPNNSGTMGVGEDSMYSYKIDIDGKVRVDLTPDVYSKELLPNLDKVSIATQKLTEYVLNPNHEDGKYKAFRIKEKLGYDLSSYKDFLEKVIVNLNKYPAIFKGDFGFGNRYEVIIPMSGIDGKTVNVLTCWIDNNETKEMSLTSIYIK